MKFESIHIGYRPGDGWQLQWLLSGISSANTIRIERSAGPYGPWDIIDTVSFDTVFYCDYVPEFRSVFKNFWYRLIVEDSGEDVLVSKAQSSRNSSDYITNEIIRQHNLLLYGVNNHPGFYARDFACYKPDRFGVRECSGIAPNGEDFLGGNDFGDNTIYERGYLNPITFKGRWIDTFKKDSNTMALGRMENLTRQLWTSNFPTLEKGDVICERSTGKNYEILGIDVRMPNNILVSQNIVCKQIDPQFWESKNLRYPEVFEPWRLPGNCGWWEGSTVGKKGTTLTGSSTTNLDGSSKLTFERPVDDCKALEFCVFTSFEDLDKLATSFLFSIANSTSTDNYIGLQCFPATPGDASTNVLRVVGRDSSSLLFTSTQVPNPDENPVVVLNLKGATLDLWYGENKVIDNVAHGWGSFEFDILTWGALTRTTDAFFLNADLKTFGSFNRTVSDYEIKKTIRYMKGEAP